LEALAQSPSPTVAAVSASNMKESKDQGHA
jgi:hypothetical protein